MFSKGTSLFLISQLKQGNETVPVCNLEVCEKYETTLVTVPIITWKLCIFTILIFPDLLTVLFTTFHSMNILWRFKEETKWRYLCLELFFQTLHITGMLLLVYVALPSVSILTILLVSNCCLIIPNISRIITTQLFKEKMKLIYLIFFLDFLSLAIGIGGLIWMVEYSFDDVDWSLPVGLILISFTWWRCCLPEKIDKKSKLQHFLKDNNFLVTMYTAYWKLFVYSVGIIIVLAQQNEFAKVPDALGFRFDRLVKIEYKPPSPPAIPIYEYNGTCMPGSTIAYEDENDCSGFWVRKCMSYLQDKNKFSSLKYVQCPGNLLFLGNQKCSYELHECCGNQTECGSRTNYSCTNGLISENLVFDFPDNRTDFEDWRINIETKAIGSIYPLLIMFIQIISSFLAYKSIILGCTSQIKIGKIELALGIPVILSITFTYLIAWFICNLKDECKLSKFLPSGMQVSCLEPNSDSNSWFNLFYIFVCIAELWICRHVWVQTTPVLAKFETMFNCLYYNSIFIDQALIIQRKNQMKVLDFTPSQKRGVKIKACATMWHETGKEMMKLIKSVKRTISKLNTLQGNRHGCVWETHIFFDDAFVSSCEVNSYVKEFLNMMQVVFQEKTYIATETPYGGELQWEIQGTVFLCHLKDKLKIKNKKRWSQCMYISYFLKEHLCKLSLDVVEPLDENEYILALDGDIIFNFDAVEKLIDVAKQDKKVGAVCGQIQPVGKGFIPIYQKFEYQLGHWLQKSTESILGNVLCSPGCFSLIRLKALVHPSSYDHKFVHDFESNDVEDNERDVAKNYKLGLEKSAIERYLTESTESMHYVQYDQGEDRWLCTLLIERGWKIQYSALSNCETACPETFDEFYNQRRRWSPSTVANIWDLLYNGGPYLLRKGHLSILHILYQLLILSASSIGPGSVFLMLVGGTKQAFQMSNWTALILNALIILVYLLVSIFAQRKHHIMVAKAISLVYGLFMITILISMIIEFKKEFERCTLTPSFLSLLITAGSFLFVAIIHLFQSPQWSLKFFFQTDLLKFFFSSLVFYITIPCMFLLLPFFCVFNIDDISWGTRENKTDVKVKENMEKKKSIIYRVQRKSRNLCLFEENPKHTNGALGENSNWIQDLEQFDKQTCIRKKVLDKKDNAFWNFVLSGKSEASSNFQEFLRSALKPIAASKTQVQEMSSGLQSMRTEIFLIFLFLNASWSFAIFWMQQAFEEDGTFGLNWIYCPLSEKLSMVTNSTFTKADTSQEIIYYQVDPINTVFLVLFVFILLIQMTGMILHRIRTMGHWLAGLAILCGDDEKASDVQDGKHSKYGQRKSSFNFEPKDNSVNTFYYKESNDASTESIKSIKSNFDIKKRKRGQLQNDSERINNKLVRLLFKKYI